MAAGSGRDDERRSIERELKRGSLELIVLHLLAPGEAYGYEIVSKLTARDQRRARGDRRHALSGALPPGTRRIRAVRWETPERGVPRKYYQLTERRTRGARAAHARMDLVRAGDGEAPAPVGETRIMTADDYIDRVLDLLPPPRRGASRSPRAPRPHRGTARPRSARGRCCGSSAIRWHSRSRIFGGAAAARIVRARRREVPRHADPGVIVPITALFVLCRARWRPFVLVLRHHRAAHWPPAYLSSPKALSARRSASG